MTARPASLALSLAAILAFCAAFFFLYCGTFGGAFITWWTHGPFAFDSGNYAHVADAGSFGKIYRYMEKVEQHIATGLTYPYLRNILRKITPYPVAPCAFHVCLGLAVLGAWIALRVHPALAPCAVILCGLSFTPWYVGSVYESRAAIFSGAALLWIAADLMHRRPSFWITLLSSALSVPLILGALGHAYTLAVVPYALLISRAGHHFRRIGYAALYLLTTAALVLAVYYAAGKVNPAVSVRSIPEKIEKGLRVGQFATFDNLTYANLRRIGRQFVVASVGGQIVPVKSVIEIEREWIEPAGFLRGYLARPAGRIFLAGYFALILLAFHGWSLLPDRGAASVGLFWLLGEILFFTYYAPWDGAPFGAAASVPLWGTLFVCLGGIRGRAEAIAAYCLALAVILYVHNTKTLAILGGIIP